MGVSGGLEGPNGLKMGGFGAGFKGMFRAVSEVVYMRKVGVRDENYPLTKISCPLDEVLRLDSGLAQANFGPISGGRFPDTHAYAH